MLYFTYFHQQKQYNLLSHFGLIEEIFIPSDLKEPVLSNYSTDYVFHS